VIREHGEITAAAGYRDWPGQVAHLSVLTAGHARGRGLACATASAARTTLVSQPARKVDEPERRRPAFAAGGPPALPAPG
jgi:hypothetical protein